MITLNGLFGLKSKENKDTPKDTSVETPKDFATPTERIENCKNRFERYIALQRTKDHKIDFLQSQIDELNQSLTDEKERIHKSVKKAFEQLQTEKNQIAKDMVSIRTKQEKSQIILKTKMSELKEKTERLRHSEKRLFAQIKKRESDLSVLSRLNRLAQRYRLESQKKARDVEILRTESDTLRTERDELAKDLTEIKNQNEKRQSEVLFSNKTYHDMLSFHQEEMRKLKQKMVEMEEKLRMELSKQMNETLRERQKAFTKEKETVVEQITKQYETKVATARKEAEDAAAELESVHRKKESLERKLRTAREEKEEAIASSVAVQKKMDLLERQLVELKKKPMRKEKHNAHLLKLMKEAYRKKEAELEDMVAQNTELLMGFQSFGDLLSSEEIRLKQYETPGAPLENIETPPETARESRETKAVTSSRGRKRRGRRSSIDSNTNTLRKRHSLRSRRSSGRPEGVPQVEAEPQQTDCVFECYGTPQRIEVRNKSASEVNLEGWKLRKVGIETVEEIPFPAVLGKEEEFFVYPTADQMESDDSQGQKTVWTAAAFSERGDIAIMNDAGKTMYSFEISGKDDE